MRDALDPAQELCVNPLVNGRVYGKTSTRGAHFNSRSFENQNELPKGIVFKGKQLRIVGAVQSVKKETLMSKKFNWETLRQDKVTLEKTGRSIVMLNMLVEQQRIRSFITSTPFGCISCYFNQSEDRSLASLREDEAVVIEGICNGLLLTDITIGNCKMLTRWDD